MDVAFWNTLEEEVAELVLEAGLNLTDAIGQICKSNPDASAELVLLATICFVTDLDQSIGFFEDDALAQSHYRYRVIAALAADVALLQPTQKTSADLITFWKDTGSTVFPVGS